METTYFQPNAYPRLTQAKYNFIGKDYSFSFATAWVYQIFDNVGEYYRWFYISKNKTKARDILQYLSVFLDFSCWVYGQQRQIRVRKKAFPEITEICENDLLYEQN